MMYTSKLSALALSLCLLLFLASPAFAAGGASESSTEAQGSSGTEGAAECDGSQAREGSGEQEASYGQPQYSPAYGSGEEDQVDPAGPEAKKQDRNQERVQLEKREGEYPEDSNGTGDRSRDRTRTEECSVESSSSAVPTESVEPTGTMDIDTDASVEMPALGLAAGALKGWLEGALSFFVGLFA